MNMIRLGAVTKREVQRFLRIPVQTMISPWISATLYILVFGVIIGERIDFLESIDYIDFVFPGILMMQLIFGAYGQSAFSLFFHRWTKTITEMLASPLSYTEIVLGYIIGATTRAIVVSAGVYAIAVLFTDATFANVPLFFFYILVVAILFALIGLLIGLWAEKMEQLNMLQTFIITPLIYVGGVFNSIDMLPEKIHWLVKLNPIFYMVDGIRYSMIGYSESNLLYGAIGLGAACLILFVIVIHLFKIGWKLRS
ncbi:ABC transporter [Candidatus Uhrbacteria bacterium CG_4_9_14_3_um_filter_50_9]|uniref:Transport permease protein n=1 Tax=Candidatus Uhrbacteria bacterium CG_4_9_14_3_um_filter_50_9 TaxID=1975035 RepID=A0A2M7XB04_9BACT|nr:MAG: ABC transporter [Candidatus Uhrbacteria bacterium CG_4_9_14_3_um_filter_50_9]